ncbi:CHASE3 domain-containing protein [Methylocystis sp. 9N]|uniref:histidine kinase n=1 Tax=Methylocystis borbori TaxID=3118750 RepID=A0ABU7XHU3_9HYPH
MTLAKKAQSPEITALVLGFAILAAATFLAVHAEHDRRVSGHWVRHTLKVESCLNRFFGRLQKAESDERGYLLTHEDQYRQSYESVIPSLDKELASLESLLADNPSQSEKIAQIRPLMSERLQLLGRKAKLIEEGRQDEAVAILRGGRGHELMERMEALIGELMGEEERLLHQREQALETDSASLLNAIGALMAGIAFFGIFAITTAFRQRRALEESRDSLKRAYDDLLSETAKRESLETQLRQAQKLEALGHLAGGIAHDFNNMLGVIVASLNLLRRKLPRGENDYETLIDSAMDGADRAGAVVRRLLGFSRQQPLSPTTLDANKLIADTSNLLRRALGEKVALETALAEDLWITRADQHELESAIVNLAVNARDAMSNRGKLTIETANCYLDNAYAAENVDVTPGQYVMIAVTDTGQGMPPEVVAQAFDPFFTTKPVGKGTGLGLSQVHGFVKQSGGHVKIYSEPGRGTCIKLYLPRDKGDSDAAGATRPANAPEAQPDEAPKALDLPLGKPEEIVLIVEDDDVSRRIAAQGVRELGYTTLEANGGPEAISILRDRSDVLLMITDLVMPEMDGSRLAREATFRHPSLRVLYITGYSRNAVFRNGALDPKVDLLVKPFTLEQLAVKIRSIIDRK